MFFDKENQIPKPPKNATKQQKQEYKEMKKEYIHELRGKKFKAHAIEQEKDPYIKAVYFKLTPEELVKYIKADRLKRRLKLKDRLGIKYAENVQNKIYKNILYKEDAKKFSFNLFMKSKFMLYFYGVEKERRRIRWLTNNELIKDSAQSLFFVLWFSLILATLDFILSMFRYFHIL